MVIKMQIGYYLKHRKAVTMDKPQQGTDFEVVYVVMSSEWIKDVADEMDKSNSQSALYQQGFRLEFSDLVTIDKSLIHNTKEEAFEDVEIEISSRIIEQLAVEVEAEEIEAEEDDEYY